MVPAPMKPTPVRMPELICGFTRRPGEGPTLYPSACAPQSWSIRDLEANIPRVMPLYTARR